MPVRPPLAALGCPVVVGSVVVALLVAGCTSSGSPQPAARHPAPLPRPAPSTSTSVGVAPSTPSSPSVTSMPTPTQHRTASASATPTRHRPQGVALPLHYGTGPARQVITVVAASESDTEATVQAWRRVSGGWLRVGAAVNAYLGSDGMTPHPNESLSAVPMGSYTLTQAFGHDPDPGTALPYRQTTPADWWISEAGSYYNTEQHCADNCPFTQGSPNEHLYYETPFYDYAAVIDYNTANAPGGVRQGAGSAFFLHVSVGAPTAGCVSIPEQNLVALLQWLQPSAHPRILIGTAGG